jgi:hypothetical protein
MKQRLFKLFPAISYSVGETDVSGAIHGSLFASVEAAVRPEDTVRPADGGDGPRRPMGF